MYDVRLINMPFANLHIPSLGLTQLRAAVLERFGDEVSVRVHYLNHDFAHFFGVKTYRDISAFGDHQNSGVGDWFFRQEAFAGLDDNLHEYFLRYYPAPTPENRQFKITVIELRHRLPGFLEELVDRYDLASADLVGFTSMFQQNVASFALARRIKDRDPSTVVVVGGANCESPMGQEVARAVPQVDFVFSGAALRSFPELIAALRGPSATQPHRIHGVFSRRNVDNVLSAEQLGGEGEALLQPGAILPRGSELDVNAAVELDFDGFLADLERHFPGGTVKPVLPFETSRGCWWGELAHCTFCGLNGETMNYRSMRPENARKLLESLFERYGHVCKQFMSVDNIMPREYLTEVFPHVRPPEGASIFYEVKADLSHADLEVLGRSGVTIIQPGIESFATSTLKLMRKGVSAARNISFLLGCVEHGVYPTWNLLVGFPGEEEEVYRKYTDDIPLLTHLTPPTGVYPVRFDRYSPYYDQAEEYGLDLEPLDHYRYTYPMGAGALANLAYYFADRNHDAPYIQNMVAWIDRLRELVLAWQRAWHERGSAAAPALYVDERADGAVVVDTRSGSTVEHPLDGADRALLSALSEPRRLDRLEDLGEDAGERLERYRRRGWLFQEGERGLSLVLPAAAAASRYSTSPVAEVNLDVELSDRLAAMDSSVQRDGDEGGPPVLAPVPREDRRVSRESLADLSTGRAR